MEHLMTVSNVKKAGIPRYSLITAGLFILLFIFTIISLGLGRYGLSLGEIIEIIKTKFFGAEALYDPSAETVLLKVRLPRVIAAVLVGSALSVSGATYQGLFRNPMVSPDLLGASSGAGFGAAIALLLGMNIFQVQISSFMFGIIAVFFTYGISTIVTRNANNTLTLVLTGMVVSALFSAFISIIKYTADPNSKLPEITFWLMGGLSSIQISDIWMLIIPVLIGTLPLILIRYRLNVLAFGDEEAKSLGINTRSTRLIIIICATLVTSACVAASGMIGWIGLVIPHFARMLVGPNYRHLLPVSLLLGGMYLLIIDNISRCLFAVEIPLGILTALVGAPFFIYLLTRGKKGWI